MPAGSRSFDPEQDDADDRTNASIVAGIIVVIVVLSLGK